MPTAHPNDVGDVLRLPLADVARPSPGARPMTADLGEYRGVYTRVVDDPRFRTLTPAGQATWWLLKMRLPPIGIGVVYLAALTPYCGGWTLPHDLERALDELVREKWIRVDGDVVWLVNGLKYEPNIRDADGKHRKYVQRLVGNLPQSSKLVAAFRAYYAAWFVPVDASTRRPSQGPSKGLRRPDDDGDGLVVGHRGRSIAARARETNGHRRPSRLRTE